MATPLISPRFQAFDPRTGTPLAFGKLFSYEAGTSSDKSTYTNVGGTVTNTNPVVLDGSGCCDVFLSGKYKIVLQASDGYQVWSKDEISDLAHIYEEWVYPTPAVYVSAVQFKVSGSTTDIFVSGRNLKISDAVTIYAAVSASYYSAGYTYVTISAEQPITTAIAYVSVSGATTATRLAVARSINGVPFDGTSDISVPAVEFTSSTGSAVMPSGTTAQRDSSPSAGYTRWNSTITAEEVWTGSAWARKMVETSSTGSAVMPSGTTAQRDPSPLDGYTRWNTTLGSIEAWNGSVWVQTIPPGVVSQFAAGTAPSGWLKANGAAVSRSTYAALFAVIGTAFGAGDGSTTFALPDLRGEFIRGWDDSRGVDSGRSFGSLQLDSFQGHEHTIYPPFSSGVGGGILSTVSSGYTAASGGIVQGGHSSAPRYGSETKPRNVALLACIKY